MKWLLLIYFTQGGSTERLMNFYATKAECQVSKQSLMKLNTKLTKVKATCVNKLPH